MTDAEQALWRHLRSNQLHGAKFRRQRPLGTYIVDFVCFNPRIVIEVDRAQHLGSTSDKQRDEWLNSQGFTVLRFWSNEVLTQLENVLQLIADVVCSKHNKPLTPTPLPQRGEGLLHLAA